uniref:Uncharacterized protein n=1 Tax=Anguilla anguilla TaxID=7936 RepID=A0A0E9XZN5_ANGAN
MGRNLGRNQAQGGNPSPIHFTKYKQNIQIRISCTVMCTLLQYITIIIKHFIINIYNSN